MSDRVAYASRRTTRGKGEDEKRERETASPPSSSPAIDSKCHGLARVHPSVRSFVQTYVRTYATVVRAITPGRRVLLGEQQFRSMSFGKSLQDYRSSFIRYNPVKPRARVNMRYYKIPVRERTTERAHTEESRPCFFGLRFSLLFPSARTGSPWPIGAFFRLPYRVVERRARVTRPKVSGRVSLSPARAAPAVRARATRASALRGPRGPYPLGIYPDFYIADKVLATLGEGTFGKVVKVKDLQM